MGSISGKRGGIGGRNAPPDIYVPFSNFGGGKAGGFTVIVKFLLWGIIGVILMLVLTLEDVNAGR